MNIVIKGVIMSRSMIDRDRFSVDRNFNCLTNSAKLSIDSRLKTVKCHFEEWSASMNVEFFRFSMHPHRVSDTYIGVNNIFKAEKCLKF